MSVCGFDPKGAPVDANQRMTAFVFLFAVDDGRLAVMSEERRLRLTRTEVDYVGAAARSCSAALSAVILHRQALVAAMALLTATAVENNAAAGEAPPAVAAPIVYDIPAQSVDSALDAYIRASGAQVFYETALAVGRRSTAVKGRLAPALALETLLTGTGLVSRSADADAFVIAMAPEEQAGASARAADLSNRFAGALQAGVRGALCKNLQTRPGGYKVALELWISSGGVVQRTELIGSTGDAARDAAVGDALQGLAVDAPPPVGTPQPLIMAIAPRPLDETGDCAIR